MWVLELLAFAPLSAPQLAAAMGAHPRTARRVLARLTEEGYLTRDDDARRKYQPTMRLVALAAQVIENSTMARRARPYVTLLHERTGVAAHLVVPSYQQVVCLVHCADAEHDAAPRMRELVPAHATAGGKVLLAWRELWRESLLGRPLERYTDRTITDTYTLRGALDGVRVTGRATEDGEYEKGVRAIAAPVLVAGEAVGALCVSGAGLDVAAAAPHVEHYARAVGDDLEREDR
jgi:DNA-binding IclR family transcriptional regulator